MQVGDKVTFTFATKQREGVIVRLNPKSVVLKVDFEHHKGKLLRRKRDELK